MGIEIELANRVDQRVLKWFVHVERINEYSIVKRPLMAEVTGEQVRGRPW